MTMDAILTHIQSEIYAQTGKRTTAHYKQGYGALYTEEGAELTPDNVIYAVSEIQLIIGGQSL